MIGMMKSIGRRLPGLSSASASRFVDAGGEKALKYMASARSKMGASASPDMIRNSAIRKRQRAVGARYVGGGTLGMMGLGTAMRPGPNERMGGFNPPPMAQAYNPISMPQGSGRFA